MDNKEAIEVIKNNWPSGRVMIQEALTLAIKALEKEELDEPPAPPRGKHVK